MLVLTPLLAVAPPQPAAAAGVVSECTETALRSALEGGGLVTFSGCGTIVLTSQLEISANTTIAGGGAVTLDGQGSTRLIQVASGVTLNLVGLTLANGSVRLSGGDGGAIFNDGQVAITGSTLTGNSGYFGGAIINVGTLTIAASTLQGNGASFGGAIQNAGSLTIIASTLMDNSANYGGAISNNNNATVTISASTLANNSTAFQPSGAIENSGSVTINASTLAGNGGGTIYNNLGTVLLTANILSGSTVCGGLFIINSNGYNVASDGSCNLTAAGDLQNANLLLGGLANNGGGTLTMLPQPGSPALGRVPTGICTNLSVLSNGYDQRGAPRPKTNGAPCDSGSVETGSSVRVQVLGVSASPSSLDEGARATFTVTASGPAGSELHYTFGCPGGDVGPQAGPVGECYFAEPGAFEVPVTASQVGAPLNNDEESVAITVHNLAPVIGQVMVSQDRSLLAVRVEASDPGGGELSYRFDCAGSVIGPQAESHVLCDLGTQTGELAIIVEVSDAQQARTTHTVQVEIPASICGWRVQRPGTPGFSTWDCRP
jgi:hypothetical protein